MLVNLNDSKISKIVYKLDEEHTIEFNYDNGELVSVEGIVQKQDNTKDPFLKILETTRTEDFNDMLRETFGGEQKENEFKKILNKEGDKLNEKDCDIARALAKNPKITDEDFFNKFCNLDKTAKLMGYEKDGKLDEITKKYATANHYNIPMDSEELIDIVMCDRSLEKLQNEIMDEIHNSKMPIGDDLIDKVIEYRRYLATRAELVKQSELKKHKD